MWKIKWSLTLLLISVVFCLILPGTIFAVDITSGFTLDKYKIELPTYPGGEKSVDIVITNSTDTPSTYLINLRVPDVITDDEKSKGYIPVDVLQYEWFSYQKEVTAQGNGSVTINLNVTIPSDTKLSRIDAWLDIQEENVSTVKMDWATTILLDIYPNKQTANKHQVVYQGQDGQLIGQGGVQNSASCYYLFLLLIIPAVVLPIIYIRWRYEVKLILLKVTLEKRKFPVKVIISDSEGQPVKDASVRIGEKMITTDEKGTSLISNTLRGTQNYIVEHPDFEAKSGSITIGKEQLVEEE